MSDKPVKPIRAGMAPCFTPPEDSRGPVVEYEHHGCKVSVRKNLKGRHREHCLCYSCHWFVPEDRKRNCSIANKLYNICVDENVVTPVWECSLYKPFGQKEE